MNESENPYASASEPEPVQSTEEIEDAYRPHYIVKSVTPLSRIFMIEVSTKGMFKVQIQVTLHFVNESLNPGTAPKIKQYTFSNDMTNYKREQEFLKQLEEDAMRVSTYYRRMKKVKK